MITSQKSKAKLRVFAFALMGMFASYVFVYYVLTRRERLILEANGIRGTLYVPIEDVFRSHDLSTHHRRRIFFAPANWVDVHVFRGRPPVAGITWGSDPVSNSRTGASNLGAGDAMP
jgi:hypothetical protein